MKISVFPLFIALLSLFSCQSGGEGEARPQLTASIAPLSAVVQAIAGDSFAVSTLVPPGSGPETYEPTPRQMVALGASGAFFRIGTLGFERTRLEKIAESAPDVLLVNVSEGIVLLPDTHGHSREAAAEAASDGGDQHVWTSPLNLKVMARNVCRALCRLDEAGASAYEQRLQRFENRADSVDAAVRQLLSGIRSRTFLIYHPALGYFARDYGLRQLSVEHDGKEPSAERIDQLIRQCREEQVRVVFIQKEHTGRAARRIAEETGARIVEIDPLSPDWAGEMLHVAKALAQ